jgi:sugar lactone lactonase YvrE
MKKTSAGCCLLVSISFVFLTCPAPALEVPAESYTFTTLAGLREPGPGFHDGSGNNARFNLPTGIVVDSAGYLYVADISNHTIRKISPSGMVMTLAGMAGSAGSSDGTGSGARFMLPQNLALDSAGNVYVADAGNHVIRRITPSGTVTTIAGVAGAAGSADGAGAAARFFLPSDLAVSADGTIYVADTENHVIRKITAAGVVSTLAGSVDQAGNANGTGSAARFAYPQGITIDIAGDLLVADTYNHLIRKVTTAGVVTTVAGTGSAGHVDGIGSAAKFEYPYGVAVDRAGAIYVADSRNHVIRKIVSGTVSTLCGAAGVFGSEDGTGQAARFSSPLGLSADGEGNIYVADTYNHLVRKVTPLGIVTTVAGLPISFGSIDGRSGAARFKYPNGVAAGNDGNFYVADSANHTIRKVSPSGFVSTVAGGHGLPGSADLQGTDARFDFPIGIAVDNTGNIYVADTQNHTIRKITPAGAVSTLAGLAGNPGGADGTGSLARFQFPFGIAVDSHGTIFVGDTWNHSVRKITPGGVVTTLAGTAGQLGSSDGVGAEAKFFAPEGVAVDLQGNVYVADDGNHTVRKITPDGVVATLAGSPGVTGSADGTGSSATFSFPFGLTVDSFGNVFVVDAGNHTVRKITPAGEVTTICGSAGTLGGADGNGSIARLNGAAGIALDSAGNLLVADAGNHSIRKGSPAPPDFPVVDRRVGRVGSLRQFDVASHTMSSWSWSIIRYPAGSAVQFSDAAVRNPSLITDVEDTFMLRVQGWDDRGRMAIGTLTIEGDETPPEMSIASPSPGQLLLQPLLTIQGKASDRNGIAGVWCQLENSDWKAATTTNGWTDWKSNFGLSAGTNIVRAYAVDSAGNRSATNILSVVSRSNFVLRLRAGPVQPPDAMDFSLEVSSGTTGRIEVSSDLSSWVPLAEFDSSQQPLFFRDITATNFQQRFYRAIVP